jgi:hypothetical protein
MVSQVWAFTLLNEPGLGTVGGAPGTGGSHIRPGNTPLPNNKPILAWLAEAVQIFKQEIVNAPGFGALLISLDLTAFFVPFPSSKLRPNETSGSVACFCARICSFAFRWIADGRFSVHKCMLATLE